jgi:uncharacterized protein DUF4349
MSELRTDEIVRELRTTGPSAPDELRERVRALPEPATRRTFRLRLRPALVAATAGAVALAVGAAVLNGLTGNSGTSTERQAVEQHGEAAQPPVPRVPAKLGRDRAWELSPAAKTAGSNAVPPSSRLQDYEAFLRVRVDDGNALSNAMKQAVRETRRLGGYVVTARYSQGAEGDASLVVRVPIARVQDALVRFSSLGTILSQRISLQDLQGVLDRQENAIADRRSRIAELEAKERRSSLTPGERAELRGARRALQRLQRGRAALVREGSLATLSLELTTRHAAAKKEQPGAFDNFLDDAGSILGKEAIGILYALVVVGPFALLAALALLGERTRRRRSNQTVLERAGSTG